MRLSEQSSYSTDSKHGAGRVAVLPGAAAFPCALVFCLLLSPLVLCAQGETTIQLDDNSKAAPAAAATQPAGIQPEAQPAAESPKELKKEIKALYADAEKNRKKKQLLYAVQGYKEILTKDPLNKKAKQRLSTIYEDTKIKLEDRVFTQSEEAYYAQSVIFYTNNDLTGALGEWGKYLAIDPQNDEVLDFYNTIKQQLMEEYTRKKQEELEAKIKKLLEDGVDYFNAMKYKEAEDRFRTILNLSPGHVQASYYLDQIAAITKKPEKTRTIVIKETTPSPTIDNDKANDFYNQGLREYASGHLREAVELWKKCLKYNPNHEKAKANLIKAEQILEGK